MYIVEPIIIMFNDTNWTHPNIQEIVDSEKDEDQLNESCEVWMGPWVRIFLEQENKTIYTVCRFSDRTTYENHLKYCYPKFNDEYEGDEKASEVMQEIVGFLTVALQEDVWAPGGEQFVFSEVGKKLNDYFDFNSKFCLSLISPDVGIHDEGDHWAWST